MELVEGVDDEQGVVSSDGTYIDLNIPSREPYTIKGKIPQVSWTKFKDGVPVRARALEPDDGIPVIDYKKSKGYTEHTEYWVKVVKNKTVDKIEFKDIVIPVRLYFKYNSSSEQPFTVRDEKGRVQGVAITADSEDGKSVHIYNVNIAEEYRGRGVANALYDFIEKKLGKKITRDTKGLYKALSDDGKKMWDKRNSR